MQELIRKHLAALERAPASEKPFEELEALLKGAGKWDELLRLYEERATNFPDSPQAATLWARAANLLRTELNDQVRAEQLYRRALGGGQAQPEALDGLRVLYESKGDLAALAEVLERRAVHLERRPSGRPEDAAGTWFELGQALEKLGRKDKAVLAYQKASRGDPKRREAFARTSALFQAMGRHAMALDTLDQMRERFGPEGLVPQYVAIAERLADSAPEHPLAARAVLAALEIKPNDRQAQALRDALAAWKDGWKERIKQLRLEANEERDRKRMAHLFLSVALAHFTYDAEPDARKKGREFLDRALLLWPGMPAVLDALEGIAARANDFKSLDEELEKLSGETKDRSAGVEILVRLATLRVTRFGDRKGALAALLKAAALDASRAEVAGLAVDLLLDEGRTQDAAALLDKHLAALSDPRAQLALRLRLAELARTRLNDPAAARTHLEAALQLAPGCVEAARALLPLYEEAGDAARLAAALEAAIPALKDPGEKSAALERLAALQGDKLQKPADAARSLARALVLQPDRVELKKPMEKQAAACGGWDAVLLAYRAAADLARPEVGRAWLRRVAELLESPLNRLQEAMEVWKRVLELDPADELAAQAVESLLARTGAHQELAEGYERQLEQAADPKAKRAILDKMVRSLEQAGADPSAAAALYRRILELQPDDLESLKRLGAASAALEKWDEVADVASRLAAAAREPAERREWQARRAQVLAERLGRKEEAAELWLALFDEEPGRAWLVAALEKVASSGVLAKRVSEKLLPYFLEKGEPLKAASALQTIVAGTEEPARKAVLLAELAALHEEKLVDPRAAFSWMEKAFRLAPQDPVPRAEIERLAQVVGSQAELGAMYMEIADRLADAALKRKLLMRSSALAEAANEGDLAVQALDKALALPEGRLDALRALHRLAAKTERWGDCEKALRGLLDAAPQEGAALWPELSTVCERLGKLPEAAAALEKALEQGGKEAELLPRLTRLFEQLEDPPGLQKALERELAFAEKLGDRDRSARLRLKLSKLLGASGDKGRAVQNYAAVLAERPSDPEAVTALEKMLQSPELREAAARALAPAYEAVKEYRKLVYALEVLSECEAEPAARAQLLRRAAQVHAVDLRQPDLAFATLARALRLTPGDAQLRVVTRKIAEESGSLEAYVEVLTEAAEATAGTHAAPLWRELAEVSEKKLGDRAAAIGHLRRLLEVDDANLDALRGLHRLHRLTESWPELAAICQRLAEVIYDPSEKLTLWREAGTLYEALGKLEPAADCFRALAEGDRHDRDAAIALERLYDKLQRPADLAFALDLRRRQEGDSPAGREVAFRLAEIQRTQVKDTAGALSMYGQILASDPTHAAARAALETWAKEPGPGSVEAMRLIDPVLERAGEHPRRVALREARLGTAVGEERAALAEEIRRIYERDMGRPELAFMSACRAFSEGIDREKAQPELERLARDTGSFEELAGVYEACAEASAPGDEMGLLSIRRAAQIRAQLGETERAVALFKDLLGEVPGDREALEALARLHEKNQNAKELSEVYRQQAQLAQDPAQRAQLLWQAATAKLQVGEEEAAAELGRAAVALSPKSRPSLELLERAYDKLKQGKLQADVLKQLADLADDALARRAALLKRAGLLEREGELGEAVEGYAQILQESPGEAAAVEGLERLFQVEQAKLLAAKVLEPFYRAVEDSRHLADVIEVKAGAAEPQDRLKLLAELARLRESLGQRPLAFAALLRCFRDVPQSPKLREELERLAAETGSFEELAAAYEDQLERETDAALQLELWRRLGAIYSDRLGRPDRSAQAFEEVYRRAPGDKSILETLSRIYRRTSSLRELAAVLWRQVALIEEPARKRELLFELAQLCEERLADRDGAIGAWKEIRKLKEDDLQAQSALTRLLAESNRFDEQADLLVSRISQADKQGKAEESLELQVELGRIKLGRLNDPRGALAIFAEVLAKRPGHPGAVAALEEMARAEGGLRAEAALALEPVFLQAGEHLKLVQMLEARAQGAQPHEKAMLLRRVAELYAGPLASADMAFVYAGRALEAAPDEPESLSLAVKYAQAAGTQEELAALVQEVSDKARTDQARAGLQRVLAKLLASELDQPDQATAAYKKLLELAPGDPEALDGLGALLREQGQWHELLEVLRRQLAAAQGGTGEGAASVDAIRADLLRRIGEVQDDRLDDASAAIATFRRLVELVPDDATALERLERLCQKTERWAELADTLAREVQIAAKRGDADGEVALKYRLAQVREVKLLDRMGAMSLYREIVQARPGHQETVARLEAIVEKDPSWDEAADALLDVYRATNAHAKLAKLLEERSSAVGEPGARKKYLTELAKIRAHHQERPELAFLALSKAFREDPLDAEVRRSLERAAEQSETQEELAELYEEEMHRLDGADAADVCLKLGQLYEQGDEADKAVDYYEKARAFDRARSHEILPALDRLYREKGDWGRLAEVLQAMVDLSEDKQEKMAILFRLGQLLDERIEPRAPERAARAFEQILELDPAHLPAARSVEKLYEAAGQHEKQFAMLELQRQSAVGSEKERLTLRMGEVAAKGLNDPKKAVELYGEVIAHNPRSEPAFLALEALYEQTGQQEVLVELIKKRLAATVDPREITRLSDKLGRVLGALNRQGEAIASFKAALERDPRHRKALDALRAIYEQQAPSEELAQVLRRLIPLQDDVTGTKQIRLRLAEVLAELGRREEAIESTRRVLDVEPHDPTELRRAEELFRKLNAHADEIKAMEARAERLKELGDTAGAVSAFFAIAEVHQKAGKREAAAPAFEKILDVDGKERMAFDSLREIYASQSDWRRYAAVSDKFLPGVEGPNERVEILKDLGQVQETKLGQKDIAFLSYCRACEIAPADEAILEAMHRLAGETGSWDELATVLEQVVETVEKGPLAEKLYLALSRIQDENLDDPDEAEAALRKVLEFDPANRGALESLGRMFARRGRDQDYVVALEQKLEAAASIEERKQILKEIAKTCQERLNQPSEAAQAYARVLELDADRETYRALAELYRGQRKWNELADTLIRARDFESEPQARSALQVEVAEVYEREILDDEAAVAGYQLALELDPQNRAALGALERLFTKLDRPSELLAVYDGQLHIADLAERVGILFKQAGIWEDKYQNLANADACLEGVLTVDPTNLQAIRSLERLRKADAEARQDPQRWEDLIAAYERHLSLQPEAREQVELMVAAGEVHYRELKRIDRAAQYFHQALELDPRSREAMHALGLLYERSGNWPFALDMLGREAELYGASKEAVELFHRIGKINEEMLLDTAAAKTAYSRALQIEAGYLPALKALKELHRAEKDWDNFLTVSVQEAEHTVDLPERAKAWLEVARFYLDSREDRDSAATYFEKALELSPEMVDAARPLADVYVANGNWERAEAMLDIVSADLSQRAAHDPEVGADLCRQLYRLGYVCEKLKKSERALAAYERAYKLDATYLLSAEGYANLLVATSRWQDALAVYQAIIIHHSKDLTDLELVEYYAQVGELFRKLGQTERAQMEFKKALSIDGTHEPSLRSQVELCEELGNWEGAMEFRTRLVPLLEDDARVQMLMAVGKTAQEKLKDPYRAIEAYSEASRFGAPPELLEALLGLYRETRQSVKAVECLDRLLAIPAVVSDAPRAKKLFFAQGEIYRDEIKDVAKAAESFNRALDLDFRFVQAFGALEAALGAARQWDLLEQNYHRMIKRLPASEDTRIARMTLFKALADFYERVRKDKKATRQVLQVVIKGLPDDVASIERYAALASEEPGAEKEAIDGWRRALPVSGQPQKAVREVARLCAKTRDYDGAFTAAQVAAFLLGETGTEEREILTKLTPYARRKEQAAHPLSNKLWTSMVFHPKVRGPMGEILALVYDRLGPNFAKKHSAFGVDPKAHRIDLDASLELAISSYKYALGVLDMQALDLYSPFLTHTRERLKAKGGVASQAPDKDLFLDLIHTHPVALKAGGRLFVEHSPRELYFLLARAMAWSRPELVLARVLTAEKLEAVFQAAVLTGVPSFKLTADPRAVDVELKQMSRLEPQYRSALARLAREYVKTAAASDVRDFIEGAELTTTRVGALLCGDLEVVKAQLGKEAAGASRVSLRARVRDLVLFCLSADYGELRGALGLKIEVKLPGQK